MSTPHLMSGSCLGTSKVAGNQRIATIVLAHRALHVCPIQARPHEAYAVFHHTLSW